MRVSVPFTLSRRLCSTSLWQAARGIKGPVSRPWGSFGFSSLDGSRQNGSSNAVTDQDDGAPTATRREFPSAHSHGRTARPVAVASAQETLARMLFHISKHRTRAAWDDYQALKALEGAQIEPNHIFGLLGAMRKQVATRATVVTMAQLSDDLAQLTGELPPIPVLELVVVRAAQCNMFDTAKKHYRMLESGPEKPRLPAMAAMLNAYRRAGKFEEAIKAHAEMRKELAHPWVLNRVMMEVVQHHIRGPEGVSEARKLFDEFVANDEVPASVAKAYASMASIYLERGDSESARNIFDDMRAKDVKATPSCYAVQVRLLLQDPREKNVRKADQAARRELELTSKTVSSNSVEAVMKEYFRLNYDIPARELLEAYAARCRDIGPVARPRFAPYAIYLAFWAKRARTSTDTAAREEYLNKMREFMRATPNYFALHDYGVGMLINGFIAAGEPDRAYQWLADCRERGYRPTKDGYTDKRIAQIAASPSTQLASVFLDAVRGTDPKPTS